ncbi:MAG: hypothetical protein M3342_01595 [Bacteroidota bacterium]|nr:hypothetical protein [Flavisolibacter sp.]MBD0287502.1 hypothetical protein [Flavisolibacter sp.]MBD0351898.1 hypothetical protein [Flavisolibacter sp.]MBD0366232.1 hypothetical protein [Flavisolibacter sp.]MDQ3842697.1 hypothetical protein [Bacteroidota bacterium]
MSEYTRGMEDSGRENGGPGRREFLHRSRSGFREEFEGMNFEQTRDQYNREEISERRDKKNDNDPTNR